MLYFVLEIEKAQFTPPLGPSILTHSHLLLRPGCLGLPLLLRRRLPPPGTAVLVTLATTFWLSAVVVPMFLVLGLLLSPPAMRASSVVMFGSFFLLLFRMRRMHLILFTVTCGPLLFLAFLAISTIWWWSMTSRTTLGRFLCAPSLRPSPPSTSLPGVHSVRPHW